MPIEITMPRLSDTMEAGTIIKWNIKKGDTVSAGDVIADVETDKATMEMTAYDDGVVSSIVVPEGKSTPIGTVIAILNGEGGREDTSDAGKQQRAAASADGGEAKAARQKQVAIASAEKMTEDDSAQPKPARDSARADVRSAAHGDNRRDSGAADASRGQTTSNRREAQDEAPQADARMKVSPVARRLAEDHNIDVRSIEGSGPGGRIIKRDVLKAVDAAHETTAAVPPSARTQVEVADRRPRAEDATPLATRVPMNEHRAAASQQLAPGGIGEFQSEIVPLSSMRQTIAKRLVQSKTTIPHYQVTVTFNMDPLLELRSTLNAQLESQGVKLSVNDFLVRCCALAMHEHPYFNSSWAPEGDRIEINGEINIGIAISLPAERGGGLVVATIRNADQKQLRQISFESKALAEKARTRGLTIQEMSESTFTISNLGMFGVDNFTAIINPPNSAILAVGAAIEKPVVRNHQLTVGHEMSATLSCDHRVIDGAMAAQYLQSLKHLIENPGTLLV